MDKIPNEFVLEINRKLDKKDSFNVNKELSMIKAEVEARERCLNSKLQSRMLMNELTDKKERDLEDHIMLQPALYKLVTETLSIVHFAQRIT